MKKEITKSKKMNGLIIDIDLKFWRWLKEVRLNEAEQNEIKEIIEEYKYYIK
jgi:hypothetical protein